jgi:hypothetical protein
LDKEKRMKLIIEDVLAQKIASYLAKKPYGEVVGLLNELLAIKELKEFPAEEPDNPEERT